MTKKVEFEIGGDLMPVSGVAVLHCFAPDGDIAIAFSEYGELRATETIGLLTAALDEARFNFLGEPKEFLERDEKE